MGTPADAPSGDVTADSARLPMAAAPAMAWLALAAAGVDVFLRRATLRVLTHDEVGGVPHRTLLDLGTAATFAQNLAACAGVMALAAAFWGWIRPRPFVPISMRISLAGFAGVLIPTLLLATLLPAERTTGLVVLFTTGAAHAMTVAMGAGCLRWRAPRTVKVAFGTAAMASFFAFGSTALLVVSAVTLWEQGHPLGMAMRRTGEIAYMVAVPLAALSARPWRSRSGLVGLVLGGILAGAVLLAADVVRREPELFTALVYGATHLELTLEALPMFAPVWFAFSIAVGLGAIAIRDAAHRQLGAGSLFLLAAGYSPTTPLTVLLMATGVLSLSRALVAHSTLQAIADAERSRLVEVAAEMADDEERTAAP